MDYAKLLLANEIRKEANAEIERRWSLEHGGKKFEKLPISDPEAITYAVMEDIEKYAALIDSWHKR